MYLRARLSWPTFIHIHPHGDTGQAPRPAQTPPKEVPPVAPAIKDKNSLPDYAKPVADKIEKLGFKWEFDYEFPVPDPDKTQRVQIRDVAHIAKQADVNIYAAALKRGDKFPPGVVTKDGRFVDFNTRAKA